VGVAKRQAGQGSSQINLMRARTGPPGVSSEGSKPKYLDVAGTENVSRGMPTAGSVLQPYSSPWERGQPLAITAFLLTPYSIIKQFGPRVTNPQSPLSRPELHAAVLCLQLGERSKLRTPIVI
jgi:hypothetical protein